MNDNDKTVRKESVPPMSSGTQEQGGHLLQTGMMQPPQMPGVLGTIGKYQVIRILGEGGMGQVLLAREPVTDSLVAIKIIKPEYLKKEWAVHRFLTEARHMFKMSHPSLIRVLEVSDRPEGPYFVMPYMAGGSLAQKIKPGEALPSDTILPLARQVAEALQYAHARGIIHRDLKTSNILLDPEGRAYLCDFGLLRTVFNDSMVDVTRPQVEGTVPYMSPAIAGGKAEDTRCDIYAFGCLLYEMLTGQPPYQGPTVDAILKQIQAGPPQPIRQLNPQAPARLVAIAEHAMGRELRDRYSTMADVINDLDRAAQGKEPLGPHGKANGSPLRRNVLAVLGTVALIALAVFGLSKLSGLIGGSTPTTPLDQFTWTTTNGAITITKYTGPGGGVVIPSTINGLPVTRLADQAFCNCTNLISVKIPNSVTHIGWWTFDSCSKLTSVTIPASVTSILTDAFRACSKLSSFLVDAANPAYSSSADGVLFNKEKTCLVQYPAGKTGSYVIPNSVTSIGDAAFNRCFDLTSVTIPNSVTYIGNWAFDDCTCLTSVTIPESVTSIQGSAFCYCTNLAMIYFKGNAPRLGGNMFSDTKKATIYYQPGTTGWGPEFGGFPTALWTPQANNAASPAATAQTPFTWTTNNGAITITKYTGPGGAVTIPSTINGLPVTSIYEHLVGFGSVTKVMIPASVTNGLNDLFYSGGGATSVVVEASNPVYRSDADGVAFNKEMTRLVVFPPGKTGAYQIPNTVTCIEAEAFQNSRLTSVKIPSSVTVFNYLAFLYSGLTSITFPNSVTNTGDWTFYGCFSLTNVVIPKSVTTIGIGAFRQCGSLTSVTIPDSVTSIKGVAFLECCGLTNVIIPNSVTFLGGGAFERCTRLSRLTIPARVTVIERNPFSYCGEQLSVIVDAANPAYTSVDGILFNKEKTLLVGFPSGKAGHYEIPDGVAKIGQTAFGGCTYLTSVTIPESVTKIEPEAFRECNSLTAIYFKGNAPWLGQDVFAGIKKVTIYHLPEAKGWGGEFGSFPTALWRTRADNTLAPPVPPTLPATPTARPTTPPATAHKDYTWTTNNAAITITKYTGPGGAVTIPSTINGLPVASIGNEAFAWCAGLTNVTIPSSVTSIGWAAFDSCSRLNAIIVDAANPAYFSSVDGVVFNKDKTCLVGYPDAKAGSYAIPTSVTSIGDDAFGGCSKLTSVTIPDSVTSIGAAAFWGCPSLTSLTIPNSVTNISWRLFAFSGMTNFTIPNSVTKIEDGAFWGCPSLTSVTIPNSVISIGNSAFETCTKLTNVTVSSGVTTIGAAAFYNCPSLSNVKIPNSVTSIGDNPFRSCSGLNSIMVDAKNPAYSSSGDGVLFNKDKTCLVQYPGGKAGHYEIPNGVIRVAKGAFSGCPYLTSVTIPESVTTIGASALSECQNLTGIYFKGNAPRLGQDVFGGVKKATICHLPEAKGWGPEFGGFPTAVWKAEAK